MSGEPVTYTKVAGFRFYSDGTCDAVSITGKLTHQRAPVVDVVHQTDIRNKPTAGRLVGAMLTGGMNMLLTPARDGGYSVMIVTTAWARSWGGPPSFAGTYRRLIEQGYLARTRAQL